MTLRSAVPSWGALIDEQLGMYIAGLDNLLIGILKWSFVCERYFGKNCAEVASILEVELRAHDTHVGQSFLEVAA
jgi:hypothetical protein